jgi:hypothetical protein
MYAVMISTCVVGECLPDVKDPGAERGHAATEAGSEADEERREDGLDLGFGAETEAHDETADYLGPDDGENALAIVGCESDESETTEDAPDAEKCDGREGSEQAGMALADWLARLGLMGRLVRREFLLEPCVGHAEAAIQLLHFSRSFG